MAAKNDFTPAPEPAKDGYASCRAETFINMPAAGFLDWYLYEPIENFMFATMIVPAITHCEPLPGPAWGETNSARKIFFKDGTTALERILSLNLPHSYSYQSWAYTSPVKLMSDHAVATMTALSENGGTRIVWDYGFHARHPMLKPAVQGFVSLNWKRHLENGLGVLKRHLETHGTAKRIHDVAKAA